MSCLLAEQESETLPDADNGPLPVLVKPSFFSKIFSTPKQSLSTIKHICSSLTEFISSLYSVWATNWWALELLGWLSAAWSLSMIVLTLYLHQDKPLPQWPCDITLNSLLSVLSQLGQWGLMGSVAKAIGQLKWLWFTQIKRPLTDFVAFDEASIGPWGSFLLLVKGWLMSVFALPRRMA